MEESGRGGNRSVETPESRGSSWRPGEASSPAEPAAPKLGFLSLPELWDDCVCEHVSHH